MPRVNSSGGSATRRRASRCGWCRTTPSNGGDRIVGLVIDGYQLTEAKPIVDLNEFDPDFVICGKREIWDRMLGEIGEHGRPQLRHTLSSLALVGEELWLESTDQLREDKFYRFNQTLQELLNLAAKLPA